MVDRYTSAEERRAIEEEAARLFLDARSSGDARAWDRAYAWVALHPAHGVAFAKAEAGWELTARLREIRPPLEPEAIAGPAGRFEAMFSQRAMASLVGIALIGTLSTIGIQRLAAVDRHRTAIGEERAVSLPDGSVAHLNTDSAIEVLVRPGRRFVRLVRGEARFDVRHDPSSPFVVQASEATLRALGTDFNVRLRPDLTELTVITGSVAVRDGDAPTRRVDAGRVAAIRGGAVAVTALPRAAIDQRTAWQAGVIRFQGEPLAQVVEEMNRYRAAPLLIGDPRLAGLSVDGAFRLSDPQAFVATLTARYPIRAEAGPDGSVMLTAGGNPGVVR